MVKIEPNSIKQSHRVCIQAFSRSLLQQFVLHRYSTTPPRAEVKVPGVLRNPPARQSNEAVWKDGRWGECQPVKTGGEWDESGAMARAAARYCPLRCALIPLPIPAAAELEGSQGHTRGVLLDEGSSGDTQMNK